MGAQSDREISATPSNYANREAHSCSPLLRIMKCDEASEKDKEEEKEDEQKKKKRTSEGAALSHKGGGGMRPCAPYARSHARMLDSLPLGELRDCARTRSACYA